ncbi:MAG: hypothetical protein OEV79_09425 [candidate division WOR-3 bacterium]|nr:hypothetical protein [candidate division WOR-3 bacterium]
MYKVEKTTRATLLMVALCSMLLVYSPNGCKDPSEYEPPIDTLYPPPEPPHLLSPANHYVFMDPDAMPGTSFFIEVELFWDIVENAEIYELELVTDGLPPNIIHCQDNSWFLIIHDDETRLCEYNWRVRAGNSRWEAMTDWSERWFFEARWRPSGPELLFPANYSMITVDSLPSFVELKWDTVSDEEFYEAKIFMDTLLIDSSNIYNTSYSFLVEDTAAYWWQIRAGSNLWQYFSLPLDSFCFFVRLNR